MHSWWMRKALKIFVMLVLGAVIVGYAVMLLWNALIPDLFKGPALTFWQAVGLLVLSHLLFRGWGRWHHSGGWRNDKWKQRFEEKLAAMTPEEREKFKAEWRRRCGWEPEEPQKEQS